MKIECAECHLPINVLCKHYYILHVGEVHLTCYAKRRLNWIRGGFNYEMHLGDWKFARPHRTQCTCARYREAHCCQAKTSVHMQYAYAGNE